MSIINKTTAYAHANIALIKYWGKADESYNIPAMSSLSITLDKLGTKVAIKTSNQLSLLINGHHAPKHASDRVKSFLAIINDLYALNCDLAIESVSNIPYKAGLASSSAFYAALALAINDHFALRLNNQALSSLARIGSASAARSIYNGFALLHGGHNLTHLSSYAEQVKPHKDIDVAVIIAIVDKEEKPIGSREAMLISKKTSPFFLSFIDKQHQDINDAITALINGSFISLGQIMEHSTLKMFALMLSSSPAIMYLKPQSIALINLIYSMRKTHGDIAFFTMDAGPQVKIITLKQYLPIVLSYIENANITKQIIVSNNNIGL